MRKLSLPEIGRRVSIARRFVSPNVRLARQPAARGEFPFGLSRQALAGPPRVGGRIIPRDVDDRVIVFSIKIAVGTVGLPPVGAGRPTPPLRIIAEINWPVGRRKDKRTRYERIL